MHTYKIHDSQQMLLCHVSTFKNVKVEAITHKCPSDMQNLTSKCNHDLQLPQTLKTDIKALSDT